MSLESLWVVKGSWGRVLGVFSFWNDRYVIMLVYLFSFYMYEVIFLFYFINFNKLNYNYGGNKKFYLFIKIVVIGF